MTNLALNAKNLTTKMIVFSRKIVQFIFVFIANLSFIAYIFVIMSLAIKVDHLSKKYIIRHQNSSYETISEKISSAVKKISKGDLKKQEREEFWALNDVSFEIGAGDRVGIIGRNGAGKSTLLKILSRIVSPTLGRIEINGRVASLLEVGTGFHAELTGRENIYLNGSILGMRKEEITRKFDEIVAFSEVEKFLDTPVKRYSSGMYVRLAFGVAAHLEPEILIVDEVLAVGDAAFQKKCLGKIREVSNNGKTILFVSHNMAAIQNICDKCIYLKNGSLVQQGETREIVSVYLKSSQASKLIDLRDRPDRMGNGSVRFTGFNLKDKNNTIITDAQCGSHLNIELDINAKPGFNLSQVRISLAFDDEFGQRITQFNNEVTEQIFDKIKQGDSTVVIEIPHFPIKRGDYTITLFVSVNGEIADWIQEAAVISVESGDFFNTGKLPDDTQGSFYVNHSFKLK